MHLGIYIGRVVLLDDFIVIVMYEVWSCYPDIEITSHLTPGSRPESDPLPSTGVQTSEGDPRPLQGPGGPAGGQGDDRAGAGQHEPGDQQGLRDHQALEEDLHDQHAVQEEREPDRPPGHHHLGGQEGQTITYNLI